MCGKQRPVEHVLAISPWLTVAEAAAYLKIGETKFRAMAKAIGGYSLPGFSKELRFHRDDIDTFVRKLQKVA